ncbi:long-chain-fatty-acid--CoA ligase [Burkholderia vietnamiensis]|uniref:Long-chain-fatty-acid--CoA ligase n=1 Tax=Burkholderia vietnamiensis TaxID=60552 RepID=A0AAW7SVK8_BURVI|nr:long-chain-fatty-acid--CoA ligase [Burkholderia vietnamiensis]MBH9645803.1 long-chain-fatty-acid--CoA ligase [Burkholderia vietnamiensis]MBR8008923.1 long-chain-fatty-acid--CoA ligase [Burkholderia vietnamiensis]MDN7551258.1 long-chain-fatty-acid--CoA ligase [Burkholderia vietnamiensis]MDN7795072.1 long-chain-fatty-acid--CoA ligase [Burkholderia vietnamiensis]MDN8044429.1 long-chain-fatty-acid--CoA ligase [Burkholderia vietnamiensis]
MINDPRIAKPVRGCPSTMGDTCQLNTTTLIRHAARTYPEQEIVYRTANGGWARYTYAECYARICRGANALRALGVKPGDRVGVLDWNNRRHFELYWAVPGLGAVMVQMNLRLGNEDLAYVVGHSKVSFVCVDESLLPIAEAIAAKAPQIKGWIVMTDKPLDQIKTTLAPLLHYEDLLAGADTGINWPEIEESSTYSACYTTGTTGKPKGVYYSHRAIYLHSSVVATSLGMTLDDCSMFITPMFHGQSWGLPQAATLMANKIVLPGRYTAEDTKSLTDVMIAEGVTVTNGAPAIFQPMLQYIKTMPVKPDFSRMRMLSGATEPPLSMMIGFDELTGAEVVHGYGATETTPLVAVNRLKPTLKKRLTTEEQWNLRRKQGLIVIGVDVRIVGADGRDLPHDGHSAGEICLRGPWISAAYYDMADADERFLDGWWRSGDVGTLDENGYLKVTDRIKDVIKSGGEWISSIDMENLLMNHPAVRDAAVVGIPHVKWQERPLALVVLEVGQKVTFDQLHAHLSSAFAKWQLPDQILFVESIPKTSVGKTDKKRIRAEHLERYTE